MDKRTLRTRIESVRPNILDRAIHWFNPQAGVSRLRSRQAFALAGGYNGASKSRRSISEWNPAGNDSDGDVLPDLADLRDRSRDLIRNAPMATGAIATKVTSVVGPGLTYQSQIDRKYLGMEDEAADEWQEAAEREFNMWAASVECDAERTLNFYELTGLAFRSTLESGDVFATLPMFPRPGSVFEQKVQLLEADRVCNPDFKSDSDTISGGIERDSDGAPAWVHILKQHPGNKRRFKGEWVRVPMFGERTGRRNVLHLFRKLRPGQTRGVPDLAPVIEKLKQLTTYSEAEIDAAVISSFFTVFVKSANGSGLAPMEPTTETGGSTTDKDYKLGKGAILDLAQDEDVAFANPNRPNSGFDAAMLAFCREIGVALELPFELLVKHFTASYSAAQAALLEAWRTFFTQRTWLARKFCDPVLEAVLMESVMKGRLYAPGFVENLAIRRAYLGAKWVGPARGQIDEVKSVNAAKMRVEEEFSTRSDEAAQMGSDWDKNNRQRRKEEAARVRGNENVGTA